MAGRWPGWAVVIAGALLSACAPVVHEGGAAMVEPALTETHFVASDGQQLPLRKWLPAAMPPKAVLLAVHGFNDYSHYFDAPGSYLAAHYQVASYALDQRGFGQAPPEPGIWAGTQAYADDVKGAAAALRNQYPGLPLYLLGTSMGGAVVMIAMTGPTPPRVDGIILSAPAVWGRATMPWYQRLALWLGAHTVPNMTLSGRGLNLKPSDNYEMLVALGRDPLVIKQTRIGTIYGLVNLMDLALERSSLLSDKALILYGEKDEIIPRRPTALMLAQLPPSAKDKRRIALYEQGYHMLLRDLQRETVWKDIGAWIDDATAPLPSGADRRELSSLTEKG
ncbi:MAG: alpha/beta hydrolase [Rhodospirillales bacterium]|nr:alpha/beta hydrolase [Rhodospirillales bacterium]